MEPWLLLFFDNQTALQVSSLVGFLLLAFFIFYFFSREGRDERGRKVTAIASLAAFIMLFVSMNVLRAFTYWASETPAGMRRCMPGAYAGVLLTADAAILLVRKLPIR